MSEPLAYFTLLISVGLVFYLLVGYPLLLAYVFRKEGPPVRKQISYQPSVSVLLAVYNGEKFLRAKLDTLLALDYPANRMEIIVVSDGSTDRTEAIASEYAGRGVKLLRAQRGGKAAALNLGLPHATGEILFLTDVRQPLDPQALRHLAANFADPSVGAVTGELRILNPEHGEQADMDLYWRYELWVRNRHSRIDSLFNTTGCIYAIRRSLVQPLPPDTLTDDAVIPLRAFFAGYRVLFDPAAIAWDYPTVAGGEFRRRMRTLAGLWQVHARLPRLFTGANRMRLHFLSHKFGRLAMPWAMLSGLAAIAALHDRPLGKMLWPPVLAAVALAAIDMLLPRKFVLRRISSPMRTFLLMNVAALCSILVFVIPPRLLWGQATKVNSR